VPKPRPSGNGERVAGENHERNETSDRAFAVGVGADQLGHVADRVPPRSRSGGLARPEARARLDELPWNWRARPATLVA
jgi:hypothetical protein